MGLAVGQYKVFYYNGGVQSITLDPGTYKLQVWGGQGGDSYWYAGAKGGYAVGEVTLTSKTTLYVVCGGQGGSALGVNSAYTYNGGGLNNAGTSYKYGSGGGATHIATRSGVLANLSSYRSSVYIVAGGGAGGARKPSTGVGGGYTGGNSTDGTGKGGTQSAGGSSSDSNSVCRGSFGKGGNGSTYNSGPGGGGGWYGGGGGYYTDGSGGGSSYLSSRLSNAHTAAGIRQGVGAAQITRIAATNITYKVQHYVMNSSGSYYLDKEETKQCLENTKVTPPTMSYSYCKTPATQTVTITSATTIRYYYERVKYKLTVYHYVMNVNGIYELNTQSATDYYAEVSVTPGVRTYSYCKSPSTQTAKMTSDKSISYYYERNKCNLTVYHYVMNTSGTYDLNKQTTTAYYAETAVTPSVLSYSECTSPSTQTATMTSAKTVSYYYTRNKYDYKIQHYLMNADGTYKLDKEETQQALASSQATPAVLNYEFYVSPTAQTVNVSSSTVVKYYYERQKFKVTTYNTKPMTLTEHYWGSSVVVNAIECDANHRIKTWATDKVVMFTERNTASVIFIMPKYDLTISAVLEDNRLNSNIYKNIFPDSFFNYQVYLDKVENLPTNTKEIYYPNHPFFPCAIVYYNDETKQYDFAVADGTKASYPVGMVVATRKNFFTLCDTGTMRMPYAIAYKDSTILYLADRYPGMFATFQEVKNNIYVPIAIYINDFMIINIRQGSKGGGIALYEPSISELIDPYSKADLDAVIKEVLNNATT